ncbi:MAG: MBL fold metallo-hydrolase [Kiritimatiellia bacterium]
MKDTAPPGMYVTFWGTRGSISTPGYATEKYGGNTPCVSVACGNTTVIIDAGTGIRNLGIELAEKAKKEGTDLDLHLLLSHTHWDHIQGLPYFAPAYRPNTRLTIYGSPKKESFLESILRGQMDMNYFPVNLNALAADMSIIEFSEPAIEIGPVKVEWQEQVSHPGGSVRYRLSVGEKTAVYASDIELDGMLSPDASTDDPKPADQYREFIRGCDLLVADAQYTPEEYRDRKGWGHSSIPTVLDVAYEQGVKQLALFHHEPQHSDVQLDKLAVRYARGYASLEPPMAVFWAREGMTLEI